MRNLMAVIGVTSLLFSVTASGQAASTPRGELLYTVYCNGCHTSEVHWRAKRLAQDMPSLKVQVRRWQDNIALGWGEEDIAAVAGYLNDRYYRFPSVVTKRAEATPAGTFPSVVTKRAEVTPAGTSAAPMHGARSEKLAVRVAPGAVAVTAP